MPRSSAFSPRPLIAFGATALAALTLTFGALLWLGHDSQIAANERSAEKLVHALDEHTQAAFETIDSVLRSTQGQIERARLRGSQDAEAERLVLERNLAGHRSISSLSLRDTEGRVTILTAMTRSPMNDTSRSDYFRVHREGNVTGAFIGTPIRSQVTGDWLIPVSRRMEEPDGTFTGVIVAAVKVKFFEDFFRSLQVGKNGLVGLFRTDGVVLVREPAGEWIGKSLAHVPLFSQHVTASPRGLYRNTTVTDGIERIYAYRTASPLPLVVSLAIAVDDALAAWHREVRIYSAIWSLGALAIIGFTLYLIELGRRRAVVDQALADSAAEAKKFRNLLTDAIESLQDGFVLYGPDDRLVMMNRAARSFDPGFSTAAVPGTAYADVIRAAARSGLVPCPDGDIVAVVRDRVASHRRDFGVPVERPVGDRWHRVTKHPTSDGGVVVLRTDITALKQVNLALAEAKTLAEAATRAKSEFLAVMSHEIRTPMNAILGFARLLSETKLDADQRHSIDTISESADALMRVLNDILDYSKIEAGRVDIEEADFSLDSSILGVVSTLRGEAREKGLTLTAAIDPEIPAFVRGDAHRLRQVLINLVGNAIKFTQEGRVAIRVLLEADHGSRTRIRFEVEDTGIGIPAELQDRLFDRFTQADSSVSRRYGGTGLGLSICKRLVELMGGTIGVDSRSGRGSRFWFTLTLARGRAPAEVIAVAPQAAAATTGLRILLVDDVEANRRLAELMLQSAGYVVDSVADGAAAVQAVENQTYAAILMDVQMPGIDGYEATRRIRSLPRARQLPIIAMTAGALDEDAARSRAAGMNDHLSKPIDLQCLLQTMARWVRTRAA